MLFIMEDNFIYQFRLIIIGDSSVGKSALISKFVDGVYRDERDPTVGVDFYAKVMDIGLEGKQRKIKLQLWDTAGQERYRSITRSYYKNAAGCMLVFDITNPASFRSMTSWLDEARVCAEPNEPLFLLVGTKSDLDSKRLVSEEEAEHFAKMNYIQYIETSAKTNKNVNESFKLLASNIYAAMKTRQFDPEASWEGIKQGPALRSGAIRKPDSLGLGQRAGINSANNSNKSNCKC
jgi:small GTP-binding protein